jgi:Rv2258c-like winged HTH domain
MRDLDMQKLDAFMGKLVGDLGASLSGVLILLGDRLGLYKAMADGESINSEDLVKRTKLSERYVREWLSAQAASGYVTYDAATKTFTLPPEQAMALAQEGSPAFFAGAFDIVQAMWMDEPKITEAFKTGKGVGWHEHAPCLFRGTERFFRPGYNTNLVSSWIPALSGVKEKLESTASTTTSRPSSGPRSWRRKLAPRTASCLRPLRRRIIPRTLMISSHFSTACMTWVIQWVSESTSRKRWRRMAPG